MPVTQAHDRALEQQIYDAVNKTDGETVQYSVYLEYTDNDKSSVPKWITIEADGNKGFQVRADFDYPEYAAQQTRRRLGIE